MPRIILIETSTSLCSTALAQDGKIIEYRESNTPKSQASMTAPYIQEMLSSRNLSVKDCDAVCVSMGPGSYTGLRVGVSSAKGLCFGAGIPLLSVGTLDTLVWQAIDESLIPEGCRYIVPMVDARRMEVYSAVFSNTGDRLSEITPMIIDSCSFEKELGEGAVLFIGDGAEKCKDIITSKNAFFVQCCPKASSMMHPAEIEFNEKRFKDIAYFEPFYLKQFVATVSSKKLF